MQKTFKGGKTAKELGIDITRKFVVIKRDNEDLFQIGDIVSFAHQNCSIGFSYFQNSDHKEEPMRWSELYYAEEPKPTKETPLWTCIYKGNTYTETTINGEEIEDIDARLVELKAEQKEINSRKRTHSNLFKNK